MKREQIVTQARTWTGSPYRHMGRSKTQGVDCMGFIIGVAEELGYADIDAPTHYTTAPNGVELLAGCEKNLVRVERDLEAIRFNDLMSLKSGDILVFWGFTRGTAQHFAFVSDLGIRKTMLHAWSKHGSVVEHGIMDHWARRVLAVFNFPQTED